MNFQEMKRIVSCLFFVIILTSCTFFEKKSSRELVFEQTVGETFQNGLEITNYQAQTMDKFSVIELLVKNKTFNCLSISNDGVRRFSYVDGNWISVPDLAINESPDSKLTLDSRIGLFPETIVTTKPDFSIFSENQKI